MKLLSRSRIAAWIVLGAALFPCVARGAVGGVEVRVLPLPSPVGGGRDEVIHGRIEYRAQIKNTAKQDRVVHLRIPAPSDYRADAGTIVSRSVPIAAGQEATVSLFQFPDASEGSMEVRVEGVAEKETVSVGTAAPAYPGGSYPYSSGSVKPTVLMSRSIPLDFDTSSEAGAASGSPYARRPSYLGSAAGMSDFTFFRSELPMAQWSTNWLGYSCFDAVLLTLKDVDEMPPEVQLALRRYLECGGTVLVHGPKVPPVFSDDAMSDGDGGYYVGRGRAVASGAKDETWESSARERRSVRSVAGLRRLVDPWNLTSRKLMMLLLRADREYGDLKTADPHNLLVAASRVPIRGMFVLVLLFAVAIGPANLWLLARKKRRIWLWWDVPAISLVTCLAVFGYSVLSEGWRGHGKTASMTMLDQRTHRATTFGYASYFCPLTPSSGPRFGADTDAALVDQEKSYRGLPRGYRPPDELDARYVDLSGEQQFASGWVRARVPAYFSFCENEDRRERLSFSTKGDAPSVVNALGADIDRLYWADASGKVFEGHDIDAGAEKTLVTSADTPALSTEKGRITVQESIGSNVPGNMISLLTRYQSDKTPARWLVPGSYIAYLKKSPFVEASLPGTPSEDTAAIVYGVCEGEENGR